MIDIIEVILAKYPGIQGVTYWHTKQDGTEWENQLDGLVWENNDIPKPRLADIKKWADEYKETLERRKRVKARVYPPIGDQLDMLYKDKINGTNIWVETIAAIKAGDNQTA